MTEQPAARRLLAHQSDRLSGLFDVHAARLYRLARRLAPNADDALDLVQDTFLNAARRPDSVPRGTSEEEAWLVRVLVNLRRDQWRKETVRRRYDREIGYAPNQHQDPEKSFAIRLGVWRALDHLSPRRRAAIVMCEIEGLSVASVARLLGISAITVRWHLARGRRELARYLRPEPGESGEHSQAALAGRRPAQSRTPAP